MWSTSSSVSSRCGKAYNDGAELQPKRAVGGSFCSEPGLAGRGNALLCRMDPNPLTRNTFTVSELPSTLWNCSRASFWVCSLPEGNALMSLLRKNLQ